MFSLFFFFDQMIVLHKLLTCFLFHLISFFLLSRYSNFKSTIDWHFSIKIISPTFVLQVICFTTSIKIKVLVELPVFPCDHPKKVSHYTVSSPHSLCGGNQDFKQNMLVGGNFFWNFSGGTKKKGGSQCFVVAQWGNLSRLVNFLFLS